MHATIIPCLIACTNIYMHGPVFISYFATMAFVQCHPLKILNKVFYDLPYQYCYA